MSIPTTWVASNCFICYESVGGRLASFRRRYGGGRHEKLIDVNSKGARGTRNLFQCRSNKQGEDQKKKVFSSKISTNSGCRFKTLAIFYDFFTKITKIRAVNTNSGVLGLDLHSNSPDPVNVFGAQSSLGGHNFRLGGHKQSFGGARPRNAPPWRRA